MRVVLTGGGTGGHAVPAISIGEALRSDYPETELLFVGSRGGPEERLAANAGFEFRGISSRKLRKLISPGTLLAAGALSKGFLEASAILRQFMPDVVIGTGGYASAAVVLAQVLRGGKTIIHDADAVPGRTNRWVGRFVTRVCVAFESAAGYFAPEKVAVTGLAIRDELLDLPDKGEARVSLELEPERFTVLVIGGSQGARRLNEIVVEAVSGLRKLPVQVLHQVGERNLAEAEAVGKSLDWAGYHLRAFIDDMRSAYSAADVVISRCGSTVWEMMAIGKPAILVPYPYAHADHQRKNGEYVAGGGGGILVDEKNLTAGMLVEMIESFVSSPEEVEKMAEAARKLGRPRAAHEIAALAKEICEGK